MTTTSLSAPRLSASQNTATILGLALICYLPFITLGWGSDGDSWRIADTGRVTVATGVYTPSRYPGFPVHEIPAAWLAHVGGAAASNAGTVLMALLGVYAFLRICTFYKLPYPTLLAAALITNPAYWTTATYTIDYVWSLALLLVGFALVCHRRYAWAGLMLGLATGSRVSSFAFAVTLLTFQFVRRKDDRFRIGIAMALATAIGAVSYISIVRQYGVLRLHIGEWNSFDYLANFVYGNLMLIGPQAIAWPIVAALARLRPPSRLEEGWRWLATFSVVIIVGYEVLFLWAPLQVGYLLPVLPCLLLLLGMIAGHRRAPLVLWILLSASSSVVTVNVIRVTGSVYFPESVLPPIVGIAGPSWRGRTTVASGGLFVRWGSVVSDAVARRNVMRGQPASQ